MKTNTVQPFTRAHKDTFKQFGSALLTACGVGFMYGVTFTAFRPLFLSALVAFVVSALLGAAGIAFMRLHQTQNPHDLPKALNRLRITFMVQGLLLVSGILCSALVVIVRQLQQP